MTNSQIDQLINSIQGLSPSYQWLYNLIISVFSAMIGGLTAFFIAKYQIEKSTEQEENYRKQDIKNQRLFMLDEMKLEFSQKILSSTSSTNKHVLRIIDIGYKRYTKLLDEMFEGDLSMEEVAEECSKEEKLEIWKSFEVIQNYLSDLYTVTQLFHFKKEKKDNMIVLAEKAKKLVDQSTSPHLKNLTTIENLGQECLNLINEFDYSVRKIHIELINSMESPIVEKMKTK